MLSAYFKCFLVLLLLANSSCSKPSDHTDPRGRLTDYISKSFSVKTPADKNILMTYLIGDVKNRLEGWSEEQFREAFIDSKREFVKLVFQEVKNISPTEIEITYELSYLQQGKHKDGKSYPAKVTNKKLCQMVLENGKWYIGDVKNIKELVEYKGELSLP